MKKIWEWVRFHGIELIIALVVILSLVHCFRSESATRELHLDAERVLIYQVQDEFPEEDINTIYAYLDSGDEELREESFEAVDRILQWYEEADRCAENLYDFLPK